VYKLGISLGKAKMRDRQFRIVLSSEEHAMLAAKAERKGVAMADILRMAIREPEPATRASQPMEPPAAT
jgi:hypothetical protein